MFKENLVGTVRGAMLDRAVNEVIGGKNHIAAYNVVSRVAISVLLLEERKAFYNELDQAVVDSLGAHGVGAEVYELSGDREGNGIVSSKPRVRVLTRDGEAQGVPQLVDAAYNYPSIIRASSEKS